MYSENMNAVNNPYYYGQLTPYGISSTPYQAGKSAAAGGKTLLIIVGVIGTSIFIGMALGLGLGIGAAGLVSSLQLINVTNTSRNSTG